MTKRTALDFIARDPWAIRPDWLETICSIADREHEYAGNVQALEQKLGRPLSNAHAVTVRDGVAIVPVSGPLFRHANLMTELSGATSYDDLALDLRRAVDDPAISAIVLNIDSPGGHAKGVNELSKQIAAIRGVKPVVAYIGGDGASAAYWLASAADEIVADEGANIGSIGAMIGIRMKEGRAGQRSYTFVSSQSPLKNASPETEAGAREIQRLTDEMAQVFIDTVASNRGISADDVLEKYGQGAVFTGTNALNRGMIDAIGTLEGVIARFTSNRPAALGGSIGSNAMSKPNENAGAKDQLPEITAAMVREQFPAVAEELRAEGVASVNVAEIEAAAREAGATAERERMASIEALAMPGTEDLVAQLKADASMTAEKAGLKILEAVRAGTVTAAKNDPASAHLAALRTAEANLNAPKDIGPADKPTDDVDAAVKADIEAARKAGVL